MSEVATQEPATHAGLLGHSNRTEQIRDHRRVEVARMMLARTPVRVMASRLGVSTNTVNNDIKVIERWWQDSAIKDRAKLVERECRILDELERAWLGRALYDAVALDNVLRIMARRAKMLGLDQPAQATLELVGGNGELKQRALDLVQDELTRRRELRARTNGDVIDVESTG